MIRKEAILCRYCKTNALPTTGARQWQVATSNLEELAHSVEEKLSSLLGGTSPQPDRNPVTERHLFVIDDETIDRIFAENLGVKEERTPRKSTPNKMAQGDKGEVKKLLNLINAYPGVLGSCIVTRGGTIVASTLPEAIDRESLALSSLAIYTNTADAGKKIGHPKVHQVVLRCQQGYLVIMEFSTGILVTVGNNKETETLIRLMRHLTQLLAA
jgi:predicted regulator of Ras-like GTPase activity (Roadblock/LC7/MglB family)